MPCRNADVELKALYSVARRSAQRIGASADDADETAQMVLADLWRDWDKPNIKVARSRPRLQWESYVARAAVNRYLSLVRSEGRRKERERRWSDAPPLPKERPGVVRPPAPDPAEAEEVLGFERLVYEIEQLSTPRRREVARLSLVEELSPTEIAEELHIAPRTVRDHLTKAKVELRQRLSGPQDSA